MSTYLSKVYGSLQDVVIEREPFNEELINFRNKEKIDYLVGNVIKGLEVIDGVKFLSCNYKDNDKIYDFKKPNHELTKDELEKLNAITSKNKGVTKSSKSAYPLVPIKPTRYDICNFKVELSDGEETYIEDFDLFFPELVNGKHYIIKGNKFYPVYQLVDSEFYRSKGHSIVLKTTFMPISIKGVKSNLVDFFDNDYGIYRPYLLNLFGKEIPVPLYFFANFGVEESFRRFKIDGNIKMIYGKLDTYFKENGITAENQSENEYAFFKISPQFSIAVKRDFIKADFYNLSITATLINAFKKKKVTALNVEDKEFWLKQLGKQFTNNTTKTLKKAEDTISSLNRLLDHTTKDLLRLPDEYKQSIYDIIVFMLKNFNGIIIIDNHDLANKRLRIAEYMIVSLAMRLSKSVYRMISGRKNSVGKLKQIFSAIDSDFTLTQSMSLNLIRFSNAVNTIDLFSSCLKGSKQGPQSQKSDNGNNSVAIRGIHPSYLGKLDITSTSSNDPGMSFTISPFCEVHDPEGVGSLFFTDKPNILDDIYVDGMEDMIDEDYQSEGLSHEEEINVYE